MRKTVRGLEPRTIGAVTIEKSPRRWWSRRSAVDLIVNRAPGARLGVRAEWEDWMLAGAFGRRLIADGLKGTITLNDGQLGARIQPRQFHIPDPNPATADEATNVGTVFRTAAVNAGANILEARAGTPYGLSPAVTLMVSHPAAFLKHRLRHLLEIYDRHRNAYEGYYLGILDEHGRRVLEAGNSTRYPSGAYWVRPDLDSCSPILHGGTPFRPQPPPCPA